MPKGSSDDWAEKVMTVVVIAALAYALLLVPFMKWVQENLLIVGIGAVVIVVLAAGGFYLFGRGGEAETQARPIPRESGFEVGIESPPLEVYELRNKITNFRLIGPRPRKEADLENALIHYLSNDYPDIRRQLACEDARIDAVIDRIGIEIKYQPDSGELDRLYGQTEKYLKKLDHVILVIGYERSSESTERFRKMLEERGWLGNRVFLMVK